MAATASHVPASIASSGAAARSVVTGATMTETSTFRPPPIHAFPPFYTIQHNPVSRAQQLSQWRALILDYCRHHRIFTLSPLPGSSDSSVTKGDASDPHAALFSNRSIQRSLSPESIRQVLADLVDHKQAAWEEQLTSAAKSKTNSNSNLNAKAYIYWKTPIQWADSIYEWVMQTGQNKSIMTLFELNEGELVQSRDFYQLPTPMLRQALKHLSTQGKAQIFAGTEADDGEGVKFV
ncbi:vacuolar protein-sorting-associated protein [Pseudozyma hubeiensis SY62]|uniref:ESCRT-II complex subunit VPS25 n=1 Tax=Pseudozyma hubeiensis (strain SY62) TaxID=1305764 RepID=R9P4C5_PSEHS|nr:vacuolar protein-sorting-associated protein [Pseudozyma hubeiensis SY62]GAC92935.1 vacuolar protein-sorting-associated protein [Pseudozyma hubeiensis SY62]